MTQTFQSEEIINHWLKSINVKFEREFRIPPFRYRYDFAVFNGKLIIEIEGGVYGFKDTRGIWRQGRHVSGTGFVKDCHKYLQAQLKGWRVIRIPTKWLIDKPRTSKLPACVYRLHEVKEMLLLLMEIDQ